MSKRIQEGTGAERIVAKSRPTLNLISKTVANSSTAQSSIASNYPGRLKAPSQGLSLPACAGKPAAEDSNPNDRASSSQVWQVDVKLNAMAVRPAATETSQNLDFPASAGKPAAEGSGIVDVDSVWPNNFQISVAHVPHRESLLEFATENWSQISRRHERPRFEFVEKGNVGCSSSSWTRLVGEFTFYQKSDIANDKTIVRRITEVDHISKRDSRNIKDWLAHTPMAKDNFVDRQSSPVIDSRSPCILRFSIVSCQNESTSRVHRCKIKMACFCRYTSISRIGSNRWRSQWNSSGKNFPGFTKLQILAEVQKMMNEIQCEHEQSMYNYIVW